MPVEQVDPNVSHAESDVASHSWLQVDDEGVSVIVPEPPAAPNVAAVDARLMVYVQLPEEPEVKAAVTFLAAVIETVQVLPLVLSQPVQLENIEPEEAVAVRVTLVPLL